MNLIKTQKTVGVVTILSGFLALACLLATLIAVDFNNEVLADSARLLYTPGISIGAARWSMIFDIFGYYILLVPAILLLRDWLKERSAWTSVISFAGLAYVLIGSIGAAILAVVWPTIMEAYPAAGAVDKQILTANFKLINDMVYGGMWNLLEMSFAAFWWIGTGYLFVIHKKWFMGWLTILTGLACGLDAKSGILQLSWLHELSLNIYLLMAIIWAFALGVMMLQRRFS